MSFHTSNGLPRVLFLILGSTSDENESDLYTQKSTWLKLLPSNYKYLILRGSDNQGELLQDETLFLPVQEKYENILEKTLLGIKWSVENLEFDFLVRTNVSTYFSTKLLEEKLTGKDPQESFLGGYLDFAKIQSQFGKFRIPYIAGTGIILSRKTSENLVTQNWESYDSLPDDVAISMLLDRCGVNLTSMGRNNLSQSHIFLPTYQIRLKTSSISWLATRRMHLVHQYFVSTNFFKKLDAFLRIMLLEFSSLFLGKTELLNFVLYILNTSKMRFRILLTKKRLGVHDG